jgi:phage terminase Nu1 subunit (DNA packaging protein)
MDEDERAELNRLHKEIADLRTLLSELALIQTEALNASTDLASRVSEHLDPPRNKRQASFIAHSDLGDTRRELAEAAEQSIEVVQKLAGGSEGS